MAHERYDCNQGCPVEAALSVIGGKWKGVILYHLLDNTMRFNALQRLMPSHAKDADKAATRASV